MENSKTKIYLDNSATTKMDDRVLNILKDLNDNFYANPSSAHKLGFDAEVKQDEYIEKLTKIINCTKDEIIFTSGGTESNNLAIKGIANTYKKNGNHIITSKIEHPSVIEVCKKLEEEGFRVSYLDVDNEGKIDIDNLINEINDQTILVSIMHINNEIGSINNLVDIGNAIKKNNSKTIFHSDMVQSFSKYFVNIKEAKIDLFSVSSHKFNGPKGVGFLYKNKNVRIRPELLGGGQQNNLRSGTLNTFGNIMMIKAFLLMCEEKEYIYNNLSNIHKYFIDELDKMNSEFGGIVLNSKDSDNYSKYIVSVSFKGIKSEVLLHTLENEGIYVSSGSACSSHHKSKSNTLSAIGLKEDLIDGTIRFSFGKYNTKEEINVVINSLKKNIPILRKYHK